MLPMLDHLSPTLMAPSCKGETRTPAFGDKIRYRPSLVGGGGGGVHRGMVFTVTGGGLSDVDPGIYERIYMSPRALLINIVCRERATPAFDQGKKCDL